VTFHGLSINVDCDLSHYAGIVPCGISDARYGVTSLAALGRAERLPALDAALRRHFAASFPEPG
jgi:lipoyl(octanoyl) transferase